MGDGQATFSGTIAAQFNLEDLSGPLRLVIIGGYVFGARLGFMIGGGALFVSALANNAAFEGFLKVIHAPLLPRPFKVAALRRAIKRILQP